LRKAKNQCAVRGVRSFCEHRGCGSSGASRCRVFRQARREIASLNPLDPAPSDARVGRHRQGARLCSARCRMPRAVLEAWRRDYNETRPHSKLGWMTPQAYATSIGGDPGRGAALRQGSAPRPLATQHAEGSNQPRTLVVTG
jgi:hypothetical protein